MASSPEVTKPARGSSDAEASNLGESARPSMTWTGLWKEAAKEFLASTIVICIGTGTVVKLDSLRATAPDPFLIHSGAHGSFLSVSLCYAMRRAMPIAAAFSLAMLLVGYFSRAYGNPAVTIAQICTRGISPLAGVFVMAMQTVGAVCGSMIVWAVLQMRVARVVMSESREIVFVSTLDVGGNFLSPTASPRDGFLLELVATCLICTAVLATHAYPDILIRGRPGSAPAAVALCVFISHLLLVSKTSCGINPARTLGPLFAHAFLNDPIWDPSMLIFFAGPVLGACLSASLYELFRVRAHAHLYSAASELSNVTRRCCDPRTHLTSENAAQLLQELV